MSKFESLTKYLPRLEEDTFGTWIIDRENDGTPEHPITMPYVSYTPLVLGFLKDFYDFHKNNPDYELTHYREIVEQNGLEYGNSMKEADVSCLDAKCILAMIMGITRADRFCEGVLLNSFKDGSIKKWLERLKVIENNCGNEVR